MYRVYDCLSDQEVSQHSDPRDANETAKRLGGRENCYIVEQVKEKEIFQQVEVKRIIRSDEPLREIEKNNSGQIGLF